MMQSICPQSRCRPTAAFRRVALAVCLVSALLSPARALAAETPKVQVVGPRAVEDLARALARAFGPAGGSLAFKRIDNPRAAAGNFLAGRDMLLTLGRLDKKDLTYVRERWDALAPQEHVVGARAVAIAVHERCPVESLTLDQLESIYSGKAGDWSVFGGAGKPIRRYGLAFSDPLTTMFHTRLLPATKCPLLSRKKDSKQAIASLASDPAGIAFVDAIAAGASGTTVRTVAIAPAASAFGGPDEQAVLPNAQTIADGTYPFAEVLVLYVSPEASDAGEAFAKFILAGKGDAVFRKHGFMPTLRAVRGDILAAFEKLYGPDIKRVKASDDPADDLALAWRMVKAARVTKLDPALIGAMCDAAYELTVDVDGGETTAFAALGVLGRKVPQRQFEAAVKHAGLCERVYTDEPTPANGEFLIRSRMTVAELGTAEREFAEALAAWRGAIDVAEEANSTTLVALKARLSAFADRAQSAKKVAALAVQLDQAPHDAAVRSEMLTLHLRELDNPAEAAKYLDAAVDEATKTNCLLAAEPVENLAEEAALNLAEWYGRMINEAGVGGRRLMADRAKAYYGRFFELHEGEDDALAMRAALGVQKIGGRMPPAEDAEADDGRQRSPAVTVDLEKGEQITDLTLAEFVAAHPDLTRVTRREIGTARKLTDLRPLRKLDKLTRLELHDARQIKDLSVLAQMPNLTVLTITGLEVKDVWALEGLSKLQHLNLSGGANITDLTPLARLHRLKSLHLSGCKQVTDLKPLKGLGDLERLNLSHCRGVNDIGPLAKLARHLTWLSLHNTKLSDIMPLARMGKLKYLDLRKCEKLPYDDAVWLKKRLSECKVHFDVTAPPKAKDSDNR